MRDRYIQQSESAKRLIDDWERHGKIIVAFDFDNTVYDFHKVGDTYPEMIRLLQECQKLGFLLTCFTANEDFDYVKKYCKNELDLDVPINHDYLKKKVMIGRDDGFSKMFAPVNLNTKIYYNILLDDRAGLASAYQDLVTLINHVKEKQL